MSSTRGLSRPAWERVVGTVSQEEVSRSSPPGVATLLVTAPQT